MPPSQIFVSTRTRREYTRRHGSAPLGSAAMLVVTFLLVWAVVAAVLWWGGL